MTTDPTDPGHGHSPAAWTAVTIMLVAFIIGTAAFWFEVEWLVWASAVLLLIGAVVGLIMTKMGYGSDGVRFVPKEHA